MSRGRWIVVAMLAALLFVGGTTSALAQAPVYQWTGAGADTCWGTLGNWDPNTDYPGSETAAGADALFTGVLANRVVDLWKDGLGGPLYPEIGALRFESIGSNTQGYTIQDSGATGIGPGVIALKGINQDSGSNKITAILEALWNEAFTADITGGRLEVTNGENYFAGATSNTWNVTNATLAVGGYSTTGAAVTGAPAVTSSGALRLVMVVVLDEGLQVAVPPLIGRKVLTSTAKGTGAAAGVLNIVPLVENAPKLGF